MSARPVRVLLIEDNPGDVRLIQELLKDVPGRRFAIDCVGRLSDSFERLDADPDVILLDLVLPDSRGLDTFTTVHARAPNLPIIVLTGLSDDALAMTTLRDGAQDYLVKGQADGELLARSIRYAIERKQAELEIKSLNENLESRVLERTRELEAANEAAKAANHDLEAFTYSVSHDLRAPIRQIDGFSRILSEHTGAALDPKSQHYLRRIQDGAQHMGRLVDDLLNLAQVGRRSVRLRSVALDTVVTHALADLQLEVAGRDIEWRIGRLPPVACDPGLMKVVFTNLLANAVKYTRSRNPAVIEVGNLSTNGAPVIFVRDNGVGFDMRYADKLFGVFQRLHRAEEFEGTGVGLATVQRIIRKHGGEIWAEAEREKGATFRFTIGAGPSPAMTEEE